MSEFSSRLTLTSFVPRQVMLETATNATAAAAAAAASKDDNHKKKKKKSSDILNAVEDGSDLPETLALDRTSGDAISRKGRGREDLLRSIAEFLEGSGFAKTLSVFRSEAQIEVNSRGGSCINLEDLFDKFIELSKRDPIGSIEWSKEQDIKTKDKKRKIKQVSDSFGQENADKNHLDATLGTEENADCGKTLKVEKRKKHKVILGENMDEVVSLTVEEVAKEKNNGEKKKKKKEAKRFLEQFDLGVNQEVIAKKPEDGGAYASIKHSESVNSDNFIDVQENVDGSKKDKKKNKNKKIGKSTSDSLHTINSDKLVEETSDGVGKHDNDGMPKFGFSKDSIAISKENTTDVETTTNKKRKRSSSKEIAKQVENITAASKSKQTKPEGTKEEKEARDHKVLTCSEPSTLNLESKERSEVLSSIVLDKREENPTLQGPQKQLSGYQLANGNIENLQKEERTKPKSVKKEKHFVEPKAVNPFQRVKVDEIQFADERLQDNSYWALDDTGSGYGAKAQEVLGQVRGRDFRHEKTKKKRGTYRGGQIDLQSHSIKFNYSDEE